MSASLSISTSSSRPRGSSASIGCSSTSRPSPTPLPEAPMADDTDAIRLLIIEDSEDDTDLLVRELERGGYRLKFRRVDTPEGLQTALADRDWDLVIADYTMPRFSGADALAMVRRQTSELPFIFVSGTIGEEAAVSALKSGAQDYIVKGKTARL